MVSTFSSNKTWLYKKKNYVGLKFSQRIPEIFDSPFQATLQIIFSKLFACNIFFNKFYAMDSRDRTVSDKTGFLRQVVDIGLSHLIAVSHPSFRETIVELHDTYSWIDPFPRPSIASRSNCTFNWRFVLWRSDREQLEPDFFKKHLTEDQRTNIEPESFHPIYDRSFSSNRRSRCLGFCDYTSFRVILKIQGITLIIYSKILDEIGNF